MRALLMSLSLWCTTVPGVGASPPATWTLTKKRHRSENSFLSVLSASHQLSYLRLPSEAKRTHASLTHPWLWSLLTILRCHQARSASLSSSAEHVSICSHRTHLWSSQRSLACSAPGFSCDPSLPWWNSGCGLQLHASSSSLLLLCTRKYTMLIRNRQTQNHVSLNLDSRIKAMSYPPHDGCCYWLLQSEAPHFNIHRRKSGPLRAGRDNGRGVPGFLYNQGPGLPPDNRPEYNILAAEEDPETMFFL